MTDRPTSAARRRSAPRRTAPTRPPRTARAEFVGPTTTQRTKDVRDATAAARRAGEEPPARRTNAARPNAPTAPMRRRSATAGEPTRRPAGSSRIGSPTKVDKAPRPATTTNTTSATITSTAESSAKNRPARKAAPARGAESPTTRPAGKTGTARKATPAKTAASPKRVDARTSTGAVAGRAAVVTGAADRRPGPLGPGPRRRPVGPTTRTPPRGRARSVRSRDQRQRARRTIRARRSALATRFAAGQPRMRLLFTLVAMLLCLMAVLFKVGLLQTFQGDALRSAAANQWTRERTLPAQRGAIFDRNGNELALSVPAATVTVNPKQVEDPEATAAVFARVLDLTEDREAELAAAMAKRDRGFLYVARQVEPELAERIDERDLAGVAIVREDRRMFPGGVTARSVIGRTDIDGVGIAGLETQYEDTLKGTDGSMTIEVMPDGRSVAGSEHVEDAPVSGHDLVLSIERSVQYAVEQALLNRAGATRARGGQAIVMDTDSGEVMAMASVQIDEDTGTYEVTSGNYSAVAAYEPGSVGKVITIAGALSEGTVTPESGFYVPWRKQYTRDGKFLSDSHYHPDESLTVEQILVESSNIGTISISETMGFENQYEYMRAFGLGEVTALDFPQESPGILEPWQEWEGTEKYTVAYGQGVASTPIQLISAVNVVANDGRYVEPKLVLGMVDGDGDLQETEPSESREVISETAATQMQTMMREVVCRGTAKAAQVPGLSVAGKTGTGYIAQKNGTYFLDDGVTRAYYASFVGFLPAEDPQVTILVSIDQPDASSGDRFGGTAAAPVFQELAPIMVHELGIDPPAGSTGCEAEDG